jgi:hypothetical protein
MSETGVARAKGVWLNQDPTITTPCYKKLEIEMNTVSFINCFVY